MTYTFSEEIMLMNMALLCSC